MSVMLSRIPILRLRWVVAVLAVVAASTFASPSRASAASMDCSAGNYCQWGYNYMGSGVNQFLTGGWNYWDNSYIDKNSGGSIAHGWNTAASCYQYMSGAASGYFRPEDTGTGCGGYLQRFAQWTSGSTSYLFIDATT